MTELEIRAVDPFDTATFDAWHAAYAESQRFGREQTATVWTLEELRIQMQEQGMRLWAEGYVGILGDRVVVAGSLATPLLDNLHQAKVSVDTVPDARRQGFGSAMLGHLEEMAHSLGKSVLMTEAGWPFEGHPYGIGEAGYEFLLSHGFELGLVDIQRVLQLPAPDDLLDLLAAQAAPHHAAYTLKSWVGTVPDALVQGWVELSSSLMTEAPMGELDREPEKPNVESFREGEDMIRKQGRTKFNTVALDADGAVVAYTDIASSAHEPGRSYQWGTLVRGDARGHRLGMAVKLANLRLLQREAPDLNHVITYNAEVNAHMVGVNVEMGFVPVERMGEFQKRLVRAGS